MASDVQPKHEGPIPKPQRRDKNGILILGHKHKPKQQPQKYYWLGHTTDAKWLACRKAWFALNPPDYRGLYVCALCANLVHKKEVTLDHIITRSRDPKLKYDLDNLQPAHFLCNQLRGSMTMEAWNEQRHKK